MRKNRDHRTIRRMLVLGTALSGSWIGAGPLAAADIQLPTAPVSKPDYVGVGTIGNTLNVVSPENAVIKWNGFNIPDGKQIYFSSGGSSKNIAILNWDTSNAVSNLLGAMGSSSNVAVWVYNPAGILVGPKASFNTGSLVLTTLKPNEADFAQGATPTSYSMALEGAGTGGAIVVQRGANLAVSGGNRGLILVAPQIVADGKFEARGENHLFGKDADQDVAFVTASDVTLAYNANGPLSVTINKGTAIATDQQIVNGSVNGKNVTFAMATQSTILNALLNVGADVANASETNNGIVLAAGRSASNVTIANAADATAVSGTVDLAVAGKLTSIQDANITASANGVATLSGTVNSDGDYFVTGGGVTLGDLSGARIQQANGTVTISAGAGGIRGLGALTLQTNADGIDSGPLTLAITDGSSGGISFDRSSTIQGGTASRQSDVIIRSGTADGLVSLGKVNANNLLGSVGTAAPTASIVRTGDLTFGDVTVTGPLALSGANISTGALTSTNGALSLTAAGNLAASSITASNGAVSLLGSGATTITNRVQAKGDLTVDRGGSLSAGSLDAGGALTLGNATTRLTAVSVSGDARGATGVSVLSSGSQNWGNITSGGNLALDGGGITAGTVRSNGTTTLASAGAINANSIDSAGGVALTGTGATAIAGSVMARGATADISANRDGAMTFGSLNAGRSIAIGNGVVPASVTVNGNAGAGGTFTLASTGDVKIGGATGAAGAVSISGATTTLGNVSTSAGGIGVAATNALTIGTVSAPGATNLSAGLGLTSAGVSGGTGVTLVAQSGDLAVNGNLDGGTGNVALTATGAIALRDVRGATLSVNGGQRLASSFRAGNLALTNGLTLLGGAGGLTLGDVTIGAGGLTLDTPGTLSTGNLRIGGATQLAGSKLSFGTLDTAGATITATGTAAGSGTISGGDLTSAGPVKISALFGDGTVTLGKVRTTGSEGTLAINAVGYVQLDQADISGTADITTSTNPADIQIRNGLTAVGTVHVTSTRDIRAPRIVSTAGDIFISATNGNASGLTPGSGIDLSAGPGRSYSLDVGRAVNLGVVTGGPVSLRADSITAELIDTGTADLTLFADSGDLTIRNYVKGGNVSLGSTGFTSIGGDISASGTLSLTGDKGVSFKSVSAPTMTVASAGGTIVGQFIRTTGAATLTGRNVYLDGLDTGSALASVTAQDGELLVNRDVSGGTVQLTATQRVGVGGTVSASGNATVQGASLRLGTLLTGGTGTLTATNGDIGVDTVRTVGDATLAGRNIAIGNLDTGAALASINAQGGNLSVSGAIDGGIVKLVSDSAIGVGGAITAKTSATLEGAAIGFSSISAPTVSVTSSGALVGQSVTASGNATLQGTSVRLTSLQTGGTGTLTATGGDLTIDTIKTAGDATLAGRNVAVGSIDAGNALASVNAQGGDLSVSRTVNAGTVRLASNGAIGVGGAITAGTSATLDGGSVSFDSITTPTLSVTSAGALAGQSVKTIGNATLKGASLSLASLDAGGAGTMTATGGDLTLTSARTGGDLILSAGGVATLSGAVTAGGNYSVTGRSLSLGGNGVAQQAGGQIRLTSTGGAIRGAGTSFVAGTAMGSAATMLIDSVGGIDFANTAIETNGGNLGIRAGSGQSVTLGSLRAGTIGGIATAADGSRTVSGALTHDAGLTAGNIAAGAMTVSLSGGDLTLGDVAISGALDLKTAQGAISTGGVRAASLAIDAAGALNGTDYASSSTTRLAGGSIRLATFRTSSGDLTATSRTGDLSIGTVTATGAMTLTSAGDATINAATAGGAALIDAAGTARLGQIDAGPTLTIRAADAALTGTQSATTVAFENRNGNTAVMRLGEDVGGSGGFALSQSEIDLVKADTLLFRQGTGDLNIGTLSFGTNAGRRAVSLLGTGTMTVSGAVSGSGAGRTFRLGGTEASDSSKASAIWVQATGTGGGRLRFDDANLDLRGDRIAVGLNDGFIDQLNSASAGSVITGLVGNANSSLYNANLGGGAYDPANAITLAANRLTVRYGQYALFQNTGPARTNSGVVLGSASSPVAPALILDTVPGNNAFAMFGTINGIGGTGASLLGGNVISLGNANIAATRVNGCLAGSGTGCLQAVIIQPTLQVFQASQEDVFGSAQDLSVPFDPMVGGTNEELLTGLAALAPVGAGQ